MYENLPLFWHNIKFWTMLGLIRPRNKAKLCFIIFMPFVINILQFIHMFKVMGKLEDVVFSFFQTSALTLAIVRILNISRNELKVIRLLEQVDHWYDISQHKEQDINLEILSKIGKRGKNIARFNFYFITCAALALFSIPIFTKGQQHPWEIDIPGLDVHASPYYEIICCTQAIFLPPFYMFAFTPYSSFCTVILMVTTGLLESLRLKLENMQNKSSAELFKELRKCIEFHNEIIKFRDLFEEIIANTSMLELMCHAGGLCMLMCFFATANTTYLKIVAGFFVFLLIYSIFVKNFQADQVTEKAISIADAAYCVDWVYADKKVRTCILILIIRSQKPLQITAGGVYPLTIHSFQRIMNASYRYFTLLQGTLNRS